MAIAIIKMVVAGVIILLLSISTTSAFHTPFTTSNIFRMSHSPIDSERRRQSVQIMMAGGFLGGIFGGDSGSNTVANAATSSATGNAKINNSGKGPTNEIIKKVNGMNQRRLGGSESSYLNWDWALKDGCQTITTLQKRMISLNSWITQSLTME